MRRCLPNFDRLKKRTEMRHTLFAMFCVLVWRDAQTFIRFGRQETPTPACKRRAAKGSPAFFDTIGAPKWGFSARTNRASLRSVNGGRHLSSRSGTYICVHFKVYQVTCVNSLSNQMPYNHVHHNKCCMCCWYVLFISNIYLNSHGLDINPGLLCLGALWTRVKYQQNRSRCLRCAFYLART